MLVDAFLFNNEFDLLEIRLQELAPVVDRFILVESTTTFSGKPKPLHFANNPRFSRWRNLISVVVNEDQPTNNPWDRETRQRNAVLVGMSDLPNDTEVMLSDVDEIPRMQSIPSLVERDKVYVFEQDMFYYSMTQQLKGRWRGTRMTTLGNMREWTPQRVRFADGIPIRRGGWHFSYLGGTAAIQAKLNDFSHQEYNLPKYNSAAAITKRVQAGKDLFDREVVKLTQLDYIDHLPGFVQQNQERFKHLIWS